MQTLSLQREEAVKIKSRDFATTAALKRLLPWFAALLASYFHKVSQLSGRKFGNLKMQFGETLRMWHKKTGETDVA